METAAVRSVVRKYARHSHKLNWQTHRTKYHRRIFLTRIEVGPKVVRNVVHSLVIIFLPNLANMKTLILLYSQL